MTKHHHKSHNRVRDRINPWSSRQRQEASPKHCCFIYLFSGIFTLKATLPHNINTCGHRDQTYLAHHNLKVSILITESRYIFLWKSENLTMLQCFEGYEYSQNKNVYEDGKIFIGNKNRKGDCYIVSTSWKYG